MGAKIEQPAAADSTLPQSNDFRNSDPRYLCKTLGIREVSVVMVKDIPNAQPGSTQFVYMDGTRAEKIGTPTDYYYKIPGRYVLAHRESRWEFVEQGEPFPFEEVEQYQARRIKDRLTPEMVERYCSHLGIDLAAGVTQQIKLWNVGFTNPTYA